MHIDIPHHTACSYPTCNLGERGLEAGWQGGKKERVRLEWTQDAGRAQWTDKMTYNQLPTERETHRAHEGEIYKASVYVCIHTGTRVERADCFLSCGLRSDTEMAVCLPLPRFP